MLRVVVVEARERVGARGGRVRAARATPRPAGAKVVVA